MFRRFWPTVAATTWLFACEGLPPEDLAQGQPGAGVEGAEAALTLSAGTVNPTPVLGLAAGVVGTAPADDKSLTTPTGAWVYSGVSAAFLTSKAQQLGARLTNVEVDPNNTARFTATLVPNSGKYAVPGWAWYPALTALEVYAKLSEHQARLIDLQKYDTDDGARYAVVMVSNTGAHARDWWWHADVSAAYLAGRIDTLGARITSLKSRVVNGVTRYTAVLIKNSGADATDWWWYLDVSAATVSAKLGEHGARLIDIERRPNGNFDVVMVKATGMYWWWYPGLTSIASVQDLMAQKAARPIELERYYVNGQIRYAVILVDNANVDTRRVEQTFAGFLSSGVYGARTKRVGGAVSVSLQDDYVFDPASALKAVHHAYALGTEFNLLDAPNAFSYPVDTNNPNLSTVCPDGNWVTAVSPVPTSTSIRTGLNMMMQQSDNRVTRAFETRYTRATLNGFMSWMGMNNSVFRQIIGCGYDNGFRNDTTLTDLAHLYERVDDGSLLPAAARTTFFNILSGGTIPVNGWIANVVRDEAQKLGKSVQVQDQFIAATTHRWKGGSYDICLDFGCTNYEYVRSRAGRVELPVKNGDIGNLGYYNGPARRPVVYARFISDLDIPCAPQGANESQVAAELRCPQFKAANDALVAADADLLRGEIREALKTW